VLSAVFEFGEGEAEGAADELEGIHAGENVQAFEGIAVGAPIPLDAGVEGDGETFFGHESSGVLIDFLICGVEHVDALIEVVGSAFETGGESPGVGVFFDNGDLGPFSEGGQAGVESADAGSEDGEVRLLGHERGLWLVGSL